MRQPLVCETMGLLWCSRLFVSVAWCCQVLLVVGPIVIYMHVSLHVVGLFVATDPCGVSCLGLHGSCNQHVACIWFVTITIIVFNHVRTIMPMDCISALCH